MNLRKASLWAGALLTVAALTACGSDNDRSPPPAANPPPAGNGTPPPASNTPPASASADVPGFIAYLQGLLGQNSETAEPVDVSSFTPPTSDSGDSTVLQ